MDFAHDHNSKGGYIGHFLHRSSVRITPIHIVIHHLLYTRAIAASITRLVIYFQIITEQNHVAVDENCKSQKD